MNRRLLYFNLFGVLALAILCVAQWQYDRRLNLGINDLERMRQRQEETISQQEQTARGLTDDLTRLKGQFETEHDEREKTQKQLHATESSVLDLTAERDQLKESVSNWSKAVTERDELITEANNRIRGLGEDLNASIRKYNELTTNYNTVVTDLNELRTKSASTNSL